MENQFIYHKVIINKNLLNKDFSSYDKTKSFKEQFSDYYRNEISDTLPAGRLIGVKFNSFVDSLDNDAALSVSRTEITINDTQGIAITKPTDVRDYEHEKGDYIESFKKVKKQLDLNEKITIIFDTYGNRFPICGEFIFLIDKACVC